MERRLSPDELIAGLTGLLRPALGDPDLGVDGLERLSGGASRETWSLRAAGPVAGERRLILQRTRPGPSASSTPMAVEDRVMAAAVAHGLPLAPVVVDVDTATPVIGEARVTAHVDGETLGRRIVRAERTDAGRRHLVGRMAEALAAIHAVDPVTIDGLPPRDPIGMVRLGLDGLDVHRPAFELALRWLEANRPEPSPPAVVHGDFRVGNLMIDGDDLVAVLDWELCHSGDPLEDLGWLCVRAWRFGGDGEVGGIAPLAELVEAYSAASGRAVDVDAVRWWMVAGTLTWGLICAVQANRHLAGHVRSVELALIGRRIVENEYDVLNLMGVPGPATGAAGSAGAGSAVARDGAAQPSAAGDGADLHGRPTAAELVAAVRDHLAEDVAPGLERGAAYHLRVAGNALDVVARQLELGPALDAAHAARLAALGVADERELAAAVRSGEVADDPAVGAAIRAAVVDRLRVANPAWLHPSDS